jgi:phosphocarrier protein
MENDFFNPTISTHCGEFIVANQRGLHTRPCTEIARLSMTFSSQISLIYNNQKVSAKSTLEMLTLSAPEGAAIQAEAVGEDSQEAIEALLRLAKEKFKIDY